jgi:transposase
MDAAELSIVVAPSPAREGLRDLLDAREELRRARADARRRVVKTLLRDGHVYRDGSAWNANRRAWLASLRLNDELAQVALEHGCGYLAVVEEQVAALDRELARVAAIEPWAGPVDWLCCFRGISTRTALELLASRDASQSPLLGAGERKGRRGSGSHAGRSQSEVADQRVSVQARGM